MKIIVGILLGLGGLVALILLWFFSPWIMAAFRNTFVPNTIATTADLPWIGPGEHARYFRKQHADYNTGTVNLRYWGANFWRSEYPIHTVNRAFEFLESQRAMTDWPRAFESDAGTFRGPSVYAEPLPIDRYETDAEGITRVVYTVRIAPYRFHLVSLRPTVVVMQPKPDLIEMWGEYAWADVEGPNESRWAAWYRGLSQDQIVTTVWLKNPIEFGARIAADDPERVDGWLWFSPDLSQPMTPLPLSRTSSTAVPLADGRLTFQPTPDGWRVGRE